MVHGFQHAMFGNTGGYLRRGHPTMRKHKAQFLQWSPPWLRYSLPPRRHRRCAHSLKAWRHDGEVDHESNKVAGIHRWMFPPKGGIRMIRMIRMIGMENRSKSIPIYLHLVVFGCFWAISQRWVQPFQVLYGGCTPVIIGLVDGQGKVAMDTLILHGVYIWGGVLLSTSYVPSVFQQLSSPNSWQGLFIGWAIQSTVIPSHDIAWLNPIF